MSHTTVIKSIAIKDASAIEKAVAELQAQGVACRLEKNARPRMYYTRQEEMCDFVIRLDKAVYGGKTYDLGLQKQADGTYSVICDEWGGAVSGQLGAACPIPTTPEGRAQHAIGKFAQLYGKHAAINAAAAQGYIVESTTTDADGNIQLTVAVG